MSESFLPWPAELGPASPAAAASDEDDAVASRVLDAAGADEPAEAVLDTVASSSAVVIRGAGGRCEAWIGAEPALGVSLCTWQ